MIPGKHVRHCHLGYKPCPCCAVTACDDEHVIIAEVATDVLHVHSLDGREKGRHEIGLQRGDGIWGVCCSTDGVLYVASGPYVKGDKDSYCITSLHAYMVRYAIH